MFPLILSLWKRKDVHACNFKAKCLHHFKTKENFGFCWISLCRYYFSEAGGIWTEFLHISRVNFRAQILRDQGQEWFTDLCCKKETSKGVLWVSWSLKPWNSLPFNLLPIVGTGKKKINEGLLVGYLDHGQASQWTFTLHSIFERGKHRIPIEFVVVSEMQ